MKKTVSKLQLIKLGISLIDETGECPLCEKDWPEGELLKKLNNRLSKAEYGSQKHQEVLASSRSLNNVVQPILLILKKVIATLEISGLKAFLEKLEEWP